MDFKDYYKTLGVSKDVDEKDLKSAFKKLAKQYHPDSETGSEEKFKELNEAYEVLKDKTKRSKYDYLYSNLKNSNTKQQDTRSQTYKQKKMYSDMNAFKENVNFDEYLKQKQKEFREKQNLNKGQQQKLKEDGTDKFSDFFEMFFGKYKEKAEASQAIKKPETKRGEDFEMEIELSLEDAYHGCIRKIEITGFGGAIRRLEVTIPQGVRAGNKIKVSNEGKPGLNGGANGDLYLKVKLKEHEQFWIEADDIHSNLKIEPHEAVLGCSKKIPTLEDIVELVIPPQTNNGRLLRLRSKGLKNSKSKILGDHYVHVIIDIPKNLTEEEIKSYKYLKELSEKR
jgi:DnaJ-class molecular chaperone